MRRCCARWWVRAWGGARLATSRPPCLATHAALAGHPRRPPGFRLPRLWQGYNQELKRGLSGFHNFAVSFTVVSVLTGLTGEREGRAPRAARGVGRPPCLPPLLPLLSPAGLYGQGMTYGGPVAVTWGWVLVSFFTLLVALRWEGRGAGWAVPVVCGASASPSHRSRHSPPPKPTQHGRDLLRLPNLGRAVLFFGHAGGRALGALCLLHHRMVQSPGSR
jgi:hypothetical protein